MGPIGVFDSGYGGLTILRDIVARMPQYDYLYLGDNARAPYGNRSFDCVYSFTLQAVSYLLNCGCPLVILACNTASAKALRTIQQNDLERLAPGARVLGVIRPTVEKLGSITHNGQIGLFGTPGTIASGSYDMEVKKLYPDFKVFSQACPMWVPLVENREADSRGADYFVEKYVDLLFEQSSEIDTVLLGCTHYPLLYDKIRKAVPRSAQVICQGQIVAESLENYIERHPEIVSRISKGGSVGYLTTEHPEKFNSLASVFVSAEVNARHVEL